MERVQIATSLTTRAPAFADDATDSDELGCLRRRQLHAALQSRPSKAVEVGIFRCLSVRLGPSTTGSKFAPELPPNSPEGRENPVFGPGCDTRFLAFQSGEGGFEPPVSVAQLRGPCLQWPH